LGRWVAFTCGGFGFSLVLFAFSRHFWLSVALLLPVGFCMMLGMASSNTLIQAMTPDHLRGRVMAMYTMMFMGMAPFGSLFAGGIAEHLELRSQSQLARSRASAPRSCFSSTCRRFA